MQYHEFVFQIDRSPQTLASPCMIYQLQKMFYYVATLLHSEILHFSAIPYPFVHAFPEKKICEIFNASATGFTLRTRFTLIVDATTAYPSMSTTSHSPTAGSSLFGVPSASRWYNRSYFISFIMLYLMFIGGISYYILKSLVRVTNLSQ